MKLLLAAWLAGCAAPESPLLSAIVNGAPDPNDDAVVAITHRSGELVCSGTLISPRVVLSAAHCDLRPTAFFDYQVFVGEDARGSGARIDVGEIVVHPAFDRGSFTNDLALLGLRDEAPASPKPLAETPPPAGATVRVAGYGLTSAAARDEGIRRQGSAHVDQVQMGELLLSPAPSQPCTWDSGGPAFYTGGGVEMLAGVTSRGDSMCASYSREVRVDAQLDFIRGYLTDISPGRRELGERCLYDAHCKSNLCLAAPDEPRIRYCSRACTGGDECGTLSCDDSLCKYPLPTPGAPGASCAADSDCLAAECVTQVCAPACSPTSAACPGSLTCMQVAPIRYNCLPSSGCSLSGRSSRFPIWLLLLAMARFRRSDRRRA